MWTDPGAEVRSRADEGTPAEVFARAEELSRAGRAPGDPYCHAPAGAGLAIDPAVYTVEPPGRELLALRRGGGNAEGHHPGPVFPRRHRGSTAWTPGRRSCWWCCTSWPCSAPRASLAYGILAAGAGHVCPHLPVGIKSLVRGLKPVVFIIVFTGILNLFFTPGSTSWSELGFTRSPRRVCRTPCSWCCGS